MKFIFAVLLLVPAFACGVKHSEDSNVLGGNSTGSVPNVGCYVPNNSVNLFHFERKPSGNYLVRDAISGKHGCEPNRSDSGTTFSAEKMSLQLDTARRIIDLAPALNSANASGVNGVTAGPKLPVEGCYTPTNSRTTLHFERAASGNYLIRGITSDCSHPNNWDSGEAISATAMSERLDSARRVTILRD